MATNSPDIKDTAWVINECCKEVFICDRIRKLQPTTLYTQSFLMTQPALTSGNHGAESQFMAQKWLMNLSKKDRGD